MANQLFIEFGKQSVALGIVAAVVVPLALAVTRWQRPIWPRWQLPSHRLHGPRSVLILAFFAAFFVGPSLLIQFLEQLGFYQAIYGAEFPPLAAQANPDQEAPSRHNHLRALWASLLLAPCFLTAALALRVIVVRPRRLLADMALGIWVWLPLSALTFCIFLVVSLVIHGLGLPVTEHPLTRLTPAGDGFGGVVFILSACVAGPFLEELLFRGLLIDWSAARRYRPWVIVGFAGWISTSALVATTPVLRFAPIAFVCLLVAGLVVLTHLLKRVRPRFPSRTAASIYSTAVLFAAVHSTVWPTPIPLFVFGLGLGWITARTRSIVPAFICHGLFNLISTLFLLRGGTG